MRWFKHFSDSLSDPFIESLIDEFGAQGYLAWFGLLELVAAENGSKLTGRASFSPKFLKRKLRISTKKLEMIYSFCSEKPREKLEFSSTKVQQKFNKRSTKVQLSSDFYKVLWNFYIPKMLNLKDNYQKDLQATSKQLAYHKEEEKEEEEEKDSLILDEMESRENYQPPKNDYPHVKDKINPKSEFFKSRLSQARLLYERTIEQVWPNDPSKEHTIEVLAKFVDPMWWDDIEVSVKKYPKFLAENPKITKTKPCNFVNNSKWKEFLGNPEPAKLSEPKFRETLVSGQINGELRFKAFLKEFGGYENFMRNWNSASEEKKKAHYQRYSTLKVQ
jgi:hypothetical protein